MFNTKKNHTLLQKLSNHCVLFFSLLSITTFTPTLSWATGESRVESPSVKSQVAKILLSSLGGAILGASTLSFYDKPQDHLSNVAAGGMLGVILGSAYVTRESLEQENVETFKDESHFQLALNIDHASHSKIDGAGLLWRFAF